MKKTNLQLSLFESNENKFAKKMLDLINQASIGTVWENSFYIEEVELSKWNHLKSNKKRHLTIILKSYKNIDYGTMFTYFNCDKTDEKALLNNICENELYKKLVEDKDFSIIPLPWFIDITFKNFDFKNIENYIE